MHCGLTSTSMYNHSAGLRVGARQGAGRRASVVSKRWCRCGYYPAHAHASVHMPVCIHTHMFLQMCTHESACPCSHMSVCMCVYLSPQASSRTLTTLPRTMHQQCSQQAHIHTPTHACTCACTPALHPCDPARTRTLTPACMHTLAHIRVRICMHVDRILFEGS